MLGTTWTAPNEGDRFADLLYAFSCAEKASEYGRASRVKAWANLCVNLNLTSKTNLKLTGAPIANHDWDRLESSAFRESVCESGESGDFTTMSYYDGPSGPSTNYARSETRIVWLSAPGRFAISLCEAYLGLTKEVVEAIAGRYVRGKRKGLLRGFVEYSICVHGGWVTNRGIRPRGIHYVSLCVSDGWDGLHNEPVKTAVIEWEQ